MAVTRVRVEGLKELKDALEEFPKATGTSLLKKALTAAAEPVVRAASAAAPDDPQSTGYDLRKSITVTQRLSRRQKKKHRKGSKVEVFIGAGPLSQATQQEFGNVLHGPQPFLRPAWDANQMSVLEAIKTHLAAAIDKAAKRAARKAARVIAKTQAKQQGVPYVPKRDQKGRFL
jgi:HK97 gp10 family phage protein